MLFTKRSSRVSDLMAVTAQRNQVRPNQTQLGTLFQRFDVVNVLRCCHFPCCLTVSTEWVVLPETLGKSSPAMVVTSCSSLVAFVAPITAVVMSLAAYTFHVAPKMDPLPPKREPLPQLRDRGRGVSMYFNMTLAADWHQVRSHKHQLWIYCYWDNVMCFCCTAFSPLLSAYPAPWFGVPYLP